MHSYSNLAGLSKRVLQFAYNAMWPDDVTFNRSNWPWYLKCKIIKTTRSGRAFYVQEHACHRLHKNIVLTTMITMKGLAALSFLVYIRHSQLGAMTFRDLAESRPTV